MKYYTVWAISWLLITALGCGKKENMVLARIEPTHVIDGFNDTTHISQAVFDIKTAWNSYFVSDMYSSRIYCTDSSLSLTEVIGRPGKGPGEFISPMALCFSSDKMHVIDAGEIKVFSKQRDHWTYKEQNKVPPLRGLNECNSFIVRDSSIYFASPIDYWVSKYDLYNGDKIAAFGGAPDLHPPERNIMQLLDFNNSLYVIGVGEAVIHRYDYDGRLISYKDFRKEDLFLETISIQKDFYAENSENSLCAIFPASAAINNKIHIIFYDRKRIDSDSRYNRVLVVDPESYQITKIYELGKGGFYTCISPSLTSKNGFVTFNSQNSSIELFDLP